MTLSTSANAGLHVRYEMAGLILDVLPIPQNASAVIVEANVRLPAKTPHQEQDFTLRWQSDDPPRPAELLVQADAKSTLRIFFRVPVPGSSCKAKIYWRQHLLGEVEIPLIGMAAVADGITVEMPGVHVTLGNQAIATRAFLPAQAQGIFATALVRSQHLLASALDLDLRIELRSELGKSLDVFHIALTDEQMRQRATLTSVALPRTRGVDDYELSWQVMHRCIHKLRFRTVSKKTFLRSLRISATRFQVKTIDGTSQTVRVLPCRDGRLLLDGIASIQPMFFVTSSETGVAGVAPFTLRALIDNTVTTVAMQDDVLVTDGLRGMMLGTLPVNELHRVKHFTLVCGDTILGNLPLVPAPTAEFTGEGGFAPLDDFLWSPAADAELKDRLGKLLAEE